ncbi:MAG: sorbosone dehydrogenase family protein [Bryobacteraceae bacterium]|jgi:glucose/arabinose dehydrogenase
MQKSRTATSAVLALVAAAGTLIVILGNAEPKTVLSGSSAFASYATEKPGTWRKITPADLPKPFATASANMRAMIVPRPADAWPQALPGFKVELFASGLDTPREIRTAPNGDLFVMESNKGEILIFRGVTPDGKAKEQSVFATGLKQSFGMAFYPPGNNPQYVYAASTDSVVRFPYKSGDLKASGPAESIITGLPRGGHWTRDLAFSPDGKRLFVSVGSGSNIDDPETHPGEHDRAAIREYTPDGKFVKLYASGIRNPVGIAINPITGELWCSTNERDGLGDNLVPDYVTHVQEGAFYGWPYYYMGSNPDPRLPAHPELNGKVTVPDVLLQPHNASLELTFYSGSQFPAEYKGDIFAAEHGSWNKAMRAGYEVIRIPLKDGHASGLYEDFLTGFVTPSGDVWGRPVGVATAPDGSLMVTDDGSKSIWRVSYTGH